MFNKRLKNRAPALVIFKELGCGLLYGLLFILNLAIQFFVITSYNYKSINTNSIIK